MRVLVTGASGTVGSLVVPALLERGTTVRALSRAPDARAFPIGVETAKGDLELPHTLDGVFDDVDALLLYPHPEGAEEVVDRAARSGVRRIVLFSSASVDTDPDADVDGNLGHLHHRPVEEAVERSGLEWTHLRGGEFMINDLDSHAGTVRDEGVFRSAHAGQPGAPVHEADMADMAVAALLRDGHRGRAYEITGPEPITPEQRAETIARVLEREVSFVPLSLEEARELWLAEGVPPQMCDWLLWEPDPADEGREWAAGEIVSGDYERVMGHPGRDYARWVLDHADSFRRPDSDGTGSPTAPHR
ncbi:NAD(P)H-binding protein [Nocardiopsis alba]|uniref:NAD(P)H-binding protein n=1 Tax=Nocardiopsis alba TaxID=53437 RepID=UPI0033D98A4D